MSNKPKTNDDIFDLSAVSGQGLDDIEKPNSMPLLKIIQDGSAEVKKSHKDHQKKTMPGVEPGSIAFLKDHCVIPQPLEVIPIAQETAYVEWKPKAQGGGIVGHHTQEILLNKLYKKGTGENKYKEYLGDNELKKTVYVLVKFKKEGEWVDGIISFSGGSLSKIRGWNTVISNFRYTEEAYKNIVPPMFARIYEVSTVVEPAKDGTTYYNWNIVPMEHGTLDPKKDGALLGACNAAYKARVNALPEVKQLADATIDADSSENPY